MAIYDISEQTPERAFRHVFALNMLRRHYSEGQRVAVLALGLHELKHYDKSLREPVRSEDGDKAARIMRLIGVNRTYWFQVSKMLEECPRLLRTVAHGKLALPQAMRVLEMRDKVGEGQLGRVIDGEQDFQDWLTERSRR